MDEKKQHADQEWFMIHTLKGSKVYCDTTTQGRRFLEAYPNSEEIRLGNDDNQNKHNPDLKWFIEDGHFLAC